MGRPPGWSTAAVVPCQPPNGSSRTCPHREVSAESLRPPLPSHPPWQQGWGASWKGTPTPNSRLSSPLLQRREGTPGGPGASPGAGGWWQRGDAWASPRDSSHVLSAHRGPHGHPHKEVCFYGFGSPAAAGGVLECVWGTLGVGSAAGRRMVCALEHASSWEHRPRGCLSCTGARSRRPCNLTA